MPETLHVLIYEYVPDVVERRAPYREDHLARLRALCEDGVVVMAGGTGDPVSGALIVFRAPDATPAEEFARWDPYGKAGLVVSHRIEPWTVVVPDLPEASRPHG
jgi:uncharacterized protein